MRVEMPPRKESMNWCTIKKGECFIFADELYMKTTNIDDAFNCVCLSNGELEYFSNEDYVELASAHVVVE